VLAGQTPSVKFAPGGQFCCRRENGSAVQEVCGRDRLAAAIFPGENCLGLTETA